MEMRVVEMVDSNKMMLYMMDILIEAALSNSPISQQVSWDEGSPTILHNTISHLLKHLKIIPTLKSQAITSPNKGKKNFQTNNYTTRPPQTKTF